MGAGEPARCLVQLSVCHVDIPSKSHPAGLPLDIMFFAVSDDVFSHRENRSFWAYTVELLLSTNLLLFAGGQNR